MMISRKNILRLGHKGSTLISVMVVTTILSLMLITLQPIMFRYAERSIEERDFKQADFSSRSANDAIVAGVLSGDATLMAGINGIAADGDSLVLDNFSFTHSGMGTIQARIERVSAEEFSVITKAIVNSSQRTIAREINKNTTAGGPDINALPAYYFHTVNYTNGRGFVTTGDTPVVVANSFSLNGGVLDIAGDLIIVPSSNTFRGSSRLYLGGNLYTGSGSFSITNTAQAYIKGNLYTHSNSPITSAVLPSHSRYCPDIYDTDVLDNLYNAVPSWVRSTGTTYNSGLTLNGGSYYEITSDRTISDITSQFSASVTPDNPVYIIVNTGKELILSNPIDPPVAGIPNDPRIVFILEGNAYLYLEHQSSAIIYGTSSTRLYVNHPSKGTSTLYGQVRVGRMYNNSNNPIILNYQSNSTPGTVTWTAGLYKKATY